ncbi:MAG: glycosyltransferase family 2 protein [Bdellovibrionia bacterium]
MNQTPVTAVVITFNEEKKISNCLRSLCWADEILVIDALSQDQTKSICLDPNQPWASRLRWIENPWKGFKNQRNFALSQAKYDWVLSVDADEECSSELAQKIQSLLSQAGGPPERAYKIRRYEYFMGRLIEHGMWNPSYQDRFFHRQGVQYVNEVHEYPLFAHPPQELHEPIFHKTDWSIEKYLEKLNQYTTLEAKDRFSQGQRTNLPKMVLAFPAHFLKSLFYYGGFKDGIHGVVISLLEGASRLVRQLKIWQLMQREKHRG